MREENEMNKSVSRAFGIIFLLIEIALVPKAIDLMLNQHLSHLPAISIVALSMTFGSIALCILMSFSSMSEHESYPKHTFLFEFMIFMCCLASMTDLITRALDTADRPGLNMFVNTVYYLIGINMAYVLMLYEFLLTDADRKPEFKMIRHFAAALMILDNIAMLMNIRFGFFFTITESGMYKSAPTYWMAYVVPALIIAVTVVNAAKNMPKGRQKRTFLFFWIFALAAALLKIFNSALTVQYTGVTLSLIVIYLNIQCELDTIYIQSQVGA